MQIRALLNFEILPRAVEKFRSIPGQKLSVLTRVAEIKRLVIPLVQTDIFY